jgi:transposase Tn5 family protein
LIEPHYQQTAERIKQSDSKYILAIQDQMRLNYTHHYAKTELGRIGKTGNTEQYGLIQHSVLCVTDKNEPLGLMDVNLFDYEDFDTEIHHHHRSIKDKATSCWLDALKAMRQRLGPCEKQIITVADREGDFYEFLDALIQSNEPFVIRAKHDRYTGKSHRARGQRLWSLLAESEVKGKMDVTIQDVNSREIQEITLKLKAHQVLLPPPHKSKEEHSGGKNTQAITVNAVMAYNDEHEWVLLTCLPIDTIEQIIEIVKIYRSRWHIEDYHKVLKTGYQIDEIYLHNSRETIENLIIMASISACRLYWLIYVGRTEATIKANQLFEDFEWKAIYVYFKEKIPQECPTLSEVIFRIARLGGYKPRKKSQPPGIKTMWIGFQQFTIAARMYQNMSRKT